MKRYLIVKIAAIGDVIMAIPMIDAIRKQDAASHITWICGRSVVPLLQKFPINHLIVVDERKLLSGSKVEKIKEVLSVWKEIAFQKFDVLALGHAAKRYKIMTLWTRAMCRRRFSHAMGEMWPVPSRHHTDEYVRLILDVPKRVEIFPPSQLRLESDAAVQEILNQCVQDRKNIVLSPGGAKNALADDACRRWPIEHYVHLARLLEEKDYNIIITGGKGDAWTLEHFKDVRIINAVGKTTLLQLIALLEKCDCFVTHDSGPLHVAGLTSVKIIALFGPTNPWEKIPRRDHVHVLWDAEHYACCPCYDGKYYDASCKENICLKGISPEKVLSLINS